MIVEGVQGEGGLNPASMKWLKNLAKVTRKAGAMLILDEIQAGVGRAGSFFSFEEAGIEPDLICLSKSLSGMGLPMAVTLIRPDLDSGNPASTTARSGATTMPSLLQQRPSKSIGPTRRLSEVLHSVPRW